MLPLLNSIILRSAALKKGKEMECSQSSWGIKKNFVVSEGVGNQTKLIPLGQSMVSWLTN